MSWGCGSGGPAAGRRQGRTWTHIKRSGMERPLGAHAVEFSKTVAPQAPEGFLRAATHGSGVTRAAEQCSAPFPTSEGPSGRLQSPSRADSSSRQAARRLEPVRSRAGGGSAASRAGARARRRPSPADRARPLRAAPRRASRRPAPSIRRASERDRPNASAIAAGRWTRPSDGRHRGLLDRGGQLVVHEQPVEARLGLCAGPGTPVLVRERAREGALGIARPERPVERLGQQQLRPRRDLLVRDLHRLAEDLARQAGLRPRGCPATWTSSARRRSRSGAAW